MEETFESELLSTWKCSGQRILYPIRVSGSILGNWATNRWMKVPAHWGSGPRYCTWPILRRTTGTSFGLKLELVFSFKADESFVPSLVRYSFETIRWIRDQLGESRVLTCSIFFFSFCINLYPLWKKNRSLRNEILFFIFKMKLKKKRKNNRKVNVWF